MTAPPGSFLASFSGKLPRSILAADKVKYAATEWLGVTTT